jgi:hypothetical protein
MVKETDMDCVFLTAESSLPSVEMSLNNQMEELSEGSCARMNGPMKMSTRKLSNQKIN